MKNGGFLRVFNDGTAAVKVKANQNPSLFQVQSGLKGDGLFWQIDCGGQQTFEGEGRTRRVILLAVAAAL